MTSSSAIASRRQLLRFLAASPLLVSAARAGDGIRIPQRLPDPIPWAPFDVTDLIKSPAEAIDVFDFEPVAYVNVPPAHFGHLAAAADDGVTLRANRADFGKFGLRSRRLRDISRPDISINLFGMKWDSPIFICPTGSNRAFHPDGAIAVSKAAGAGKRQYLQFLSSEARTSIEDATKARGSSPACFQLYAPTDFEIAKGAIQRAERAGAPILAITVDSVAPRKNPNRERLRRMDTRNCAQCHDTARGGNVNSDGFSNLSWDYVRRLRDTTKMKVILKGIIAPEDGELSVKYGFDGIILSNHGGREEDSGTSTIGVLPEMIAAVNGRIPVLVDSGFRRGMDAVKALAMGAAAVGIGRPYLWGLGAFGQEGVEGVLNILDAETQSAMAQAGAANVKDLVPGMIHRV